MGHEFNDARSLAYHIAIADRLRADPALIQAATERVAVWRRTGSVAKFYVDRWTQWLALPPKDLTTVLVESSEEADALRQVSPFAGVLSPRERWALWRQTRAPQGA